MFDGLQTLLIGSTFSEYKRRVDQAKANKILQDDLKNQFVHLELSKIAANDPTYSYFLACQSVKWSDSNPAKIAWNKKVSENIKKFGKEKWEEMLEEEAKKGSPYTKERQWKKYKDSYIDDYKKKQIKILEKKYEKSFAPDSKLIKDEIKEWEDKLKKWETLTKEENLHQISKIFNIPQVKSINITNLSLKAKKVLDTLLFNYFTASKWAEKNKILSSSNKSTDEDYNQLVAYHKMREISSPQTEENEEDYPTRVANLESKVDQQNEMLKDIQDKLERLLSKKIN